MQLRDAHQPTAEVIVVICCCCQRIRDQWGDWQAAHLLPSRSPGVSFSHTICPQCARQYYPEFYRPREAHPRLG